MHLTLHNAGGYQQFFDRFRSGRIIQRVRVLDQRVRSEGVGAIDSTDPLTALGMDGARYSYGVFNLSWQARDHPEWADRVKAEVEEIRAAIHARHGVRLRYVIWAGIGGSIEDKLMYQATGLLKRGPRFYALDSTDPAKLHHILADIQQRSGLPLKAALRSTLVVGMALGMTSYEPVLNLERLAALYERYRIDSRPNFIYLTLPGSILDSFASPRGYRRVALQLDDANSTAGRHSGPLSRGSLYPLALAGVDLKAWMRGTFLNDAEVDTALQLAAFLHAQGMDGRDKVALLLPRAWVGAGIWTKQDFEESLGKSEDLGVKIFIQEKLRPAHYRADRVFLSIEIAGMSDANQAGLRALKAAGHPVAILKFRAGAPLSRFMQFIHYAVFGMAWLREMNFVTQPSVELYKSIANEMDREEEWRNFGKTRVQWRGALSLPPEASTPEKFGQLLGSLAASREIEYGELTFFGDTRYDPRGKEVRRCLDRAGERLFRSRLQLPVDIYEGPAMNHSYHEMIIGHGKCFSVVLMAEKKTADYHVAQFLATQMALERKGRRVIAITLKDLSARSLDVLEDFFRQAAAVRTIPPQA